MKQLSATQIWDARFDAMESRLNGWVEYVAKILKLEQRVHKLELDLADVKGKAVLKGKPLPNNWGDWCVDKVPMSVPVMYEPRERFERAVDTLLESEPKHVLSTNEITLLLGSGDEQ